jgi:hypothetical protein
VQDNSCWLRSMGQASAKDLKNYSLILGMTIAARLFAPADTHGLVSSLISVTRCSVLLPRPSKTLVFRRCRWWRSWHTIEPVHECRILGPALRMEQRQWTLVAGLQPNLALDRALNEHMGLPSQGFGDKADRNIDLASPLPNKFGG